MERGIIMGFITKTILNAKLANVKSKTGRNYYQLEYANGAVSLVKKGEFGGIDRLSPPVTKREMADILDTIYNVYHRA